MKLLIVKNPSASVISGVQDGMPILKKYPFFIIEPESDEDVVEATRLFGELFRSYSAEE